MFGDMFLSIKNSDTLSKEKAILFQNKSLDAYKGDSYGEINSSLRESLFDGIDPDIKNHIENIFQVVLNEII